MKLQAMTDIEQKAFPLRIEQVGLVVKNREEAVQKYASMWGVGPFRLHEVDLPDGLVRGKKTRCKAKLAFAQAGPIEIELIEPQEGESTWGEFLRERGEVVHHVGTWVSDIDREIANCREKGVEILQYGDDGLVRFAYMDTEPVAGVIIELLQHK
jgi:4-hydroxyphenylpyruvate dioxygenase-like putative hemolysin